ncbi:MAG: DUF169 domain-containing protein [Desulfobacterales bacterium]|jgi:hypothetical protein
MDSAIVRNLKPEFAPVAVVWSDTIPDGALQFKKGKFGCILFPVNPVELAVLVTLAGSVMPGTDPVQVPQGADCNRITAFACAQADLAAPRAVLGMLDVDGREVMHKRFRDDILTLTLPMPLYLRMEQEADGCVLQTPAWRSLVGKRYSHGR